MIAGKGATEKRKRYFVHAIEALRQNHNDNDYIVSKGDANLMKELKYWRMMDYFSLLVQIIKEGERHREQQKKKK